MTASEADERWGLQSGTVRSSCVRGRLEEYIEKGLVRKSGKVWLVTEQAMREVYGAKIEGGNKMFEKWVQNAVNHYNEFGEADFNKGHEEDVYRAVVAKLESANENYEVKDGEHFWTIRRA